MYTHYVPKPVLILHTCSYWLIAIAWDILSPSWKWGIGDSKTYITWVVTQLVSSPASIKMKTFLILQLMLSLPHALEMSVGKNFYKRNFEIHLFQIIVQLWSLYQYTVKGKSRFTVVSTQNTVYPCIHYYLLFIVLFSIWATVNVLLPHPVYCWLKKQSKPYISTPKCKCIFLCNNSILLKIKISWEVPLV